MPKIAERRKVLDGRAEVITYSRDESACYYREPDGSGGYRQRRLKEALSEVDAVAMAMDVWSEMRNKQQLIKTGQIQLFHAHKSDEFESASSIDWSFVGRAFIGAVETLRCENVSENVEVDKHY